MRSSSKKKFSLQLHIISLFTILITISGISLGWYSYSQLSKNMINSRKILLSNSSKEVVNKIHKEGEHIHTMLEIVNASNLTEQISKEGKIASLPVLSEMLIGTPSLSALFVAYPNDDFFLYRKLNSKVILKNIMLHSLATL